MADDVSEGGAWAVSGLAPALPLGHGGIRGGCDHSRSLPLVPGYGRNTAIPRVLSIGTKGLAIFMWADGSMGYDITAGDG